LCVCVGVCVRGVCAYVWVCLCMFVCVYVCFPSQTPLLFVDTTVVQCNKTLRDLNGIFYCVQF